MNASQFRAAFAALPPLPEPVTAWDGHRVALRRLAAKNDPKKFMKWKPIKGTISTRCDGYIEDEYNVLKYDNFDWDFALVDPGFGGNPHQCDCAPGLSGTLIHQAHHLKQWLDRTDLSVSELNTVFEVGPGFGAMALLLERLGFKGDYYVYDLPEMLIILHYYLSNIKAETKPIFECPPQADLVIAAHSLTEIPLERRGFFDDVVGDSYLIGYKDTYSGIDNRAYLDKFTAARSALSWYRWQPWKEKYGKRHWYCVGV